MITSTKFTKLTGVTLFLTVGATYDKAPKLVGLVTASPLFTDEPMNEFVQTIYNKLFEDCAAELGFKPSKRAKSGFVYTKPNE